MELALVLRELWSRRLVMALGLLVAFAAATLSVYRLDLHTFKLQARSLQYSSATTQIFVDTPGAVLGNLAQDVTPLEARATVYANFMASPSILTLIGRQVGLFAGQIEAAGPVDTTQPRAVQEPTQLKRNIQVTGETNPYRLQFTADPNLPIISVFSQAPTTEMATALANASVKGLQQYISYLQGNSRVPARSRVVIRPLGSAIGGVVNSGMSKSLAALVFVAVSFLWCLLVLLGARFRRTWKASRDVYVDLSPATSPNGNGHNGNSNGHGSRQAAEAVLRTPSGPSARMSSSRRNTSRESRPRSS